MVEISTQTELEQPCPIPPFNTLATQTGPTLNDGMQSSVQQNHQLPMVSKHPSEVNLMSIEGNNSSCLENNGKDDHVNQQQMQKRYRSSSAKSQKARAVSHRNLASPFGANDAIVVNSHHNQSLQSHEKQSSLPKWKTFHSEVSETSASPPWSQNMHSINNNNSFSTDSENLGKTIYVVNQPSLKTQLPREARSLKDLVSASQQKDSSVHALPFGSDQHRAAMDPHTEYVGYSECSHCGALSAKSLDKIHIVPTTNKNLRAPEHQSLGFRNSVAVGSANESTQGLIDLAILERSNSRHRSRDTSDRSRERSSFHRSRSRSRNKHVHISSEVISINNSLKRSKSAKSSDNNSANENCYDSIDCHNPIYINPVSSRGSLKTSNTEASFWSLTNNKYLHPPFRDESGPSSSLTTTDSREDSLLSTEGINTANSKLSSNSFASTNNVGSTLQMFNNVNNNVETSFVSGYHLHPINYHHNYAHSSSSSSTTNSKPKSLFPPFWKKGSF